jgi:hypothetical protein
MESGTTMAALEATSGITLGYASKILSPNPNKRMGIDIAVLLAAAFGYRIELVPDKRATERYRDKLQLRKLCWPKGEAYDAPIGA